MASTLPLHRHHPNAALLRHPRRRRPLLSSTYLPTPSSPPLVAVPAASPSSIPGWEREEARWLREEQRWLREEQRWLREEKRWHEERESLLAEIAALRRRVQAMEFRPPPPPPITEAAPPRPALVEEAAVKELVLEEVRVLEVKAEKEAVGERAEVRPPASPPPVRRTLRMGSEGDDVRAMQEVLQRLGFYSGEEDMEYSSFSNGTERAVKTWQASIGTHEDGVMTSDLLERLQIGESFVNIKQTLDSDGDNGAAISSVVGITEFEQTVVKENIGNSEPVVNVSHQRVFLLGENRWEEPSRLAQKRKPSSSIVSTSSKCVACQGEGRLMCTECDGTGEPNIEPQFMEWIDEGTKCPYCEGQGYTICDVCDGKAVVKK